MALVPTSSHGNALPLTGGTLTGSLDIHSATDPQLNMYDPTNTDTTFQIKFTNLGGGDEIARAILTGAGHGYSRLSVGDDLNDGLLDFETDASLLAKLRTGSVGDLIDFAVGSKRLLAIDNLGNVRTAPPVSEASTLALGTAYQHSTVRDVLLVVYLSITVNTSGVVLLGVGPTNTPTQQTIVTGVTTVGFLPVPIYLPASYYAKLSITGTITDSIAGQIAIPV